MVQQVNKEAPLSEVHFDLDWYSCLEAPIKLYGNKEGFSRLPKDYKIFEDYTDCTGIRARFTTDSPYIALRCRIGESFSDPLSSLCSSLGFDLYKWKKGKEMYVDTFIPTKEAVGRGFQREITVSGKKECYCLNFPPLAKVEAVYIGIKKGSLLSEPCDYKLLEKPIGFYGSSATCCLGSSRAGNTYPAIISQQLGLNFLNFGFPAKAKGEKEIAEYISSINMSAFVLDFNLQEADLPTFKANHYNFYKTVRSKRPFIPIIMVSSPLEEKAKNKAIIEESYRRAKSEGDSNVYFVDGNHILKENIGNNCKVDKNTLNDLGHYFYAKEIGKNLAAALNLSFDM